MADAEPGNVQVEVTLQGVEPPIWRRLVVRGDAHLGQLHRALQVAMGWEDRHLHCFEIDGVRYAPYDEEDDDADEDDVDERTALVGRVLAAGRRGTYEYDLGDSWIHLLAAEEADVPLVGRVVATCREGGRAGPPEDCGGPRGYEQVLAALGDPAHEDHETVVAWLGRDFDPEAFDPRAVNAALDGLRAPARRR